jgi:hypothetical protein
MQKDKNKNKNGYLMEWKAKHGKKMRTNEASANNKWKRTKKGLLRVYLWKNRKRNMNKTFAKEKKWLLKKNKEEKNVLKYLWKPTPKKG